MCFFCLTSDDTHKKVRCDFCEFYYSGDTYTYKIKGYGKHDGKTICDQCMVFKYHKRVKNKQKYKV